MTSTHEPTPEFERYLEWQVTTALRRQDRFARPSAAGSSRYLRGVPIVLLSVLLGAGGVMAAGRRQQNQERQLLTVQQQGDLQLAELRVSVAQKNLEETKKRIDAGVAPLDERAAAEREMQTAMLKLQRVLLSLTEVQQSGRPAQDDVTAPLVGGRDFVLERLELDRKMAAAVAAEGEKRVTTAQSRYDVGLTPKVDLLEAQAALLRSMSDMKTIDDKIGLRQKFVGGGLSPEDATRQRLILSARNELRAASMALEVAETRLLQIQNQVKIGVVGEVDALKAQIEVLTRKQDVARLQERITLLEKGGPLPDGRK